MLLTEKQAAKLAGVARKTIRRLIEQGRLKAEAPNAQPGLVLNWKLELDPGRVKTEESLCKPLELMHQNS